MVFSSSATLCTDDVDTVHMPVVSRDGIDSQGDWDPDHATSREPASDASSAHLGCGEVKILLDPAFGTQVGLPSVLAAQVITAVAASFHERGCLHLVMC